MTWGEDAASTYDENRLRARRALRRPAKPTLEAEVDYYREQAENPQNSPNDRALWKQLADEADRRLGRDNQSTADTPLSFD